MEIKVLGTGCAGCKALHDTVKQAVAELGMDATVTKVEDLLQIMSYNVMAMPGLVIDEKVVSAGKKLSLSDVKAILTKHI
ncbi:MAG: thioredoxin family protein [Phocaeicola sp.]